MQNGGRGARLRLPVAASPRGRRAARNVFSASQICPKHGNFAHTQSVLLSRWKTASSTYHERLLRYNEALTVDSSVSITASIESSTSTSPSPSSCRCQRVSLATRWPRSLGTVRSSLLWTCSDSKRYHRQPQARFYAPKSTPTSRERRNWTGANSLWSKLSRNA